MIFLGRGGRVHIRNCTEEGVLSLLNLVFVLPALIVSHPFYYSTQSLLLVRLLPPPE